MRPTKSFLQVSNRKLLRFVVISEEIHFDLDKIKSIHDMQPPKNPHRVEALQEGLAYPKIFFNLSECCQLFLHLMKKGVLFF